MLLSTKNYFKRLHNYEDVSTHTMHHFMLVFLPPHKLVCFPCYYWLQEIKLYHIWVAADIVTCIPNFVEIRKRTHAHSHTHTHTHTVTVLSLIKRWIWTLSITTIFGHFYWEGCYVYLLLTSQKIYIWVKHLYMKVYPKVPGQCS